MNFDLVEVVVEKLVRTFKLREWQYDLEDIVEDVTEALKLIGAAKLFEDKVANITIQSMVGKLPADLQNIKHLIPVSMPFKESGNFIEVDVADGTEVQLVYQAMPLDTRGYPLIPDNAAVREALMWWLVRVLTLQGEITKVSFQMADQEWDWRCGSARAELNVMGIVAWSGVANDYTRLNPLKDAHSKNYEEVGKLNTLDRDRSRFSKDTSSSTSIAP